LKNIFVLIFYFPYESFLHPAMPFRAWLVCAIGGIRYFHFERIAGQADATQIPNGK